MISTLKKIELKGANRIGVCFPCSNVQNLRHSFAARLIEVGTDNPPHPALPDQLSIKTTMIYSHISGKTINWIQSSLDRLNVQAEDKKKNEKNIKTKGGKNSPSEFASDSQCTRDARFPPGARRYASHRDAHLMEDSSQRTSKV